MNFQMTKYYFKYMQNTILTKDPAFMKGWDLLNGYFYSQEDNYLWRGIRRMLSIDHETLLYAYFVHKDKFFKKILFEVGSKKTLVEETLNLIENNIIRLLTMNQVNNTPSLKNYASMFDKPEARRLFKETYPHIHFARNTYEEERRREEYKLELRRYERRSRSRSFPEPEEKHVSIF